MSTFEVLVREIDDVIEHPNADRLNIVRVLGYNAITNKREDGTPRYRKGDLIVYVPEGAVVPENLLKQYGYWDDDKNRGMLAGSRGDRVKAINLRKICSQGLVWPLYNDLGDVPYALNDHGTHQTTTFVSLGDNLADFFGIEKYEPPIPVGMGGEVVAVYEFAFDFDIENFNNFPGFLEGEEVEATEKIHGSCSRISYRHGVTHDELFGSDGCVAIASKGLGAKGLVFKNNEANVGNLYVRVLTGLGVPEKLEQIGRELAANVDLFGEIFGPGVQDLHYGQTTPVFRAFDIAVSGQFLGSAAKDQMFARLGVERVPVLYRGPWDRDMLIGLRDGKTTIGGKNVREGIVVSVTGDQTKREFMNHRLRPFLKMVSPDYLLRKGEITEFQ